MRKIIFYLWVGLGIIIGTPIVLLIIFATYLEDKYHKLTCKKCINEKKD